MRKITLLLLILGFLVSCATFKKSNVIKYSPEVPISDEIDIEYNQGLNYLRQGLPDKALESFRRSTTTTENLFTAYGYSYLQKKNYNLSKKNFQRAIEINLKNADAHIGLMLIFEELVERDEIFSRYSELVKQFEENDWINNRLQELQEENRKYYLDLARKNKNNSEEYLIYLKKAEIFSVESDQVNLKIGQYYFDLNDYNNALKYYEKTGLKSKEGKAAMFRVAEAFKTIEKYDEALWVYKKLQKENPDDFKLSEKVDEIKDLLYESNLPRKFKNIFFKDHLTREDLAALIGYYFEKFIEIKGMPIIISDISDSYAQEYIIKLCSNRIMILNPDHSFILYRKVSRGQFSKVIKSLLDYLEKNGKTINIISKEELERPIDISPQHYTYHTIIQILNMEIMELDQDSNFNPTFIITPSEAMISLKKILNGIELE